MAARDRPEALVQQAILVLMAIFGVACVKQWSGVAGGSGGALVAAFAFFYTHLIPVVAILSSLVLILMRRVRLFFLIGSTAITFLTLTPIYVVGYLNGFFG